MVLLFGKNGQLAQAFQKNFKTPFQAFSSNEVDFRQPDKILSKIQHLKPSLVLCCSGVHDLQSVEKDPEKSVLINLKSPLVLAQWAAARKIPIVFFSGADVFDGKGSDFRIETEKTSPQNALGKLWVQMESQIASAGAPYFIFRTHWLFSATGSHLLSRVVRSTGEELTCLDNQIGSPTSANDLAKNVLRIFEKSQGLPQFPSGIYHLTGYGTCFESEWAKESFSQAVGLGFRNLPVRISALKSSPEAPPRPLNARLSNQKVLKSFGLQMPNWQDSLIKTLHEMRRAGVS